MKFSILAGALVMGLLIGAHARADVRVLDEAELKALGKFAAVELKSCPGWEKLREVAGPTVRNKTAEHLDKKWITAQLTAAMAGTLQWVNPTENVPALELDLTATQQESAQSLVSVYELKIAVKDGGISTCQKSVKLEKRLFAGH